MFANETDLEHYIRHLIATKITSQHPNIYALDNKKAVDIIVCRDGNSPTLSFLETKLFQPSHGRLGIGSQKGTGYQPEIVRRRPHYFETNLRWIIVDGREPEPAFLFVPTSTIVRYLAGNVIGEKFNNIQLRIFNEVTGLNEDLLVTEMYKFLVPITAQVGATG